LRSRLDYGEIGLKVGVEIHLQLSTERKLFCHCPTALDEKATGRFTRRLRPTQSELGQVDPAALFEFEKGKIIEYWNPEASSCLVEMDEEPPHSLNPEALFSAIRMARFLHSYVADEIHVMRKIVIDGSNTGGFQRTCIVALGGDILLDDGESVPIQTVCLEEDAARIVKQKEGVSTYMLDRLGIPLIEVVTSPAIGSPSKAVDVALRIGRIGRATGYVKDELGAIRQDANISVGDGTVVEVKGIQRLSQLRKVVEFEAQRQVSLVNISNELGSKGVSEDDLQVQPVDVSEAYEDTKSETLSEALSRGDKIYAVKLKGFSGLLSRDTAPGYRLASEMVEKVRFWTDVKGLFHTDEMPSQGITDREIRRMMSKLSASDGDAAVFIFGEPAEITEALRRVLERALEALSGVPYETRGCREDARTYFLRPRPGMSRMYPETDIPPVPVTPELLQRVDSVPITDPRVEIDRLVEMGLTRQLAREIFDSRHYDLFLSLAPDLKKVKSSFVASSLTGILRNLEKEGYDVSKLSRERIEGIFRAVDEGRTAKESVGSLFEFMSESPEKGVEESLEALGLVMLPRAEIERIVEEVVGRMNLEGEPERVLAKAVGQVMSVVRGRAESSVVSELVRKRLGKE